MKEHQSDWILVVDDDTSNLKMASRILCSEKMRVPAGKCRDEKLYERVEASES